MRLSRCGVLGSMGVGVGTTTACGLTIPDEEAPVQITDLSITVDGEEVYYQADAVAADLGTVTGAGCEPTERLHGGMGDDLGVSIDATSWSSGSTLFPGPQDWGFLSGPITGVASGGTGELVEAGVHNELVYRDGRVRSVNGDESAPYGELVLSFDGELPGGLWQNLGGAPGAELAPSGLPWCTLEPFAGGWERVF